PRVERRRMEGLDRRGGRGSAPRRVGTRTDALRKAHRAPFARDALDVALSDRLYAHRLSEPGTAAPRDGLPSPLRAGRAAPLATPPFRERRLRGARVVHLLH